MPVIKKGEQSSTTKKSIDRLAKVLNQFKRDQAEVEMLLEEFFGTSDLDMARRRLREQKRLAEEKRRERRKQLMQQLLEKSKGQEI